MAKCEHKNTTKTYQGMRFDKDNKPIYIYRITCNDCREWWNVEE